jgi:hypothetical protein
LEKTTADPRFFLLPASRPSYNSSVTSQNWNSASRKEGTDANPHTMSRTRQFAIFAAGSALILLAAWKLPEQRSVAKSLPGVEPVVAAVPVASAVAPENALPEASQREPVAEPLPPATVAACLARLKKGCEWLKQQPDYTAIFRRQERVGADVLEPESIELKLRNRPFSVTMIWLEGDDKGQIAHYQEDANRGRIAARLAGWKRRLGWLHANPHSSLAMEDSRYPITDVGMLRLAERWLESLAPYADRTDGVHCRWDPETMIGDRKTHPFTVEYDSPEVNPSYRKSTVWFDQEWSAPLATLNYDWQRDEANPEGFMERYAYERIQFQCGLTDKDFAWQTDDAVAATPD